MLKTFEVILDLENTLHTSADIAFSISGGDFDTIEVTFKIRQDDSAFDLTGLSVQLAIKKPSGLVVYQDCEITDPTAGEATIRLSNQAYIEYGVFVGEVYINSGDQVAVTCPFWYLSRAAILGDESIENQNDWSAILDLLFSYDKKPVLVEGVPNFVPEYIGQTAFDTIGQRAFISNGLTDVSWQVIGSGEGGGGGVVSWADILGKPTTFPPATHTHLWADITDKPTTFNPSDHTHLWADITDKPTEFTPEAHLHQITDVIGLQAALDAKTDPADLDPYILETEADAKYALKSETGGTVSTDWTEITNKPATFPPSAHTHPWTDVTGKPTVFPSDWGSVANKPTTFAPTAHTHTIGDVSGLQNALDLKADDADLAGKADLVHTHAIGDVTGLQEELDSKLETIPAEYLTESEGDLRYAFKGDAVGGGSTLVEDVLTSTSTTSALSANQGRILNTTKAPTVHTHTIADVTNLQAELDSKLETLPAIAIGDVTNLQASLDAKADDTDLAGKADLVHTHTIADVTGLQAELDSKLETLPPIAIGDVTDLQASLDAKADLVHTHVIADITDLQAALDAKADLNHTHTIGDITNLQVALDGKSDVGHTHAWTEITAKPTTFPPSAHTHLWADITDKPTTFTPSAHTHLWADITDKPTTFTPSAHTHLWADITDKPTEFKPQLMSGAQRGGAMVGNGLAMSNEYLLVKTLSADGTKIDTVNNAVAIDRTVVDTWYALKTHTHLWADITDKPTTFAPSAHTHPWTDVTGKPTTFAPSAHTHTEADLTFGGINAKTYVDNGDNAIINNYLTGHKIWTGTAAAYGALTVDPNTIYFVTG